MGSFGGAFYAHFVLLINAEMIFPNVLEEFLPPLYSSLLHSFIFVVSFSFTFCAFFVYVFFFLLSIVLVKRNDFDANLRPYTANSLTLALMFIWIGNYFFAVLLLCN